MKSSPAHHVEHEAIIHEGCENLVTALGTFITGQETSYK